MTLWSLLNTLAFGLSVGFYLVGQYKHGLYAILMAILLAIWDLQREE